MEVSIPVDVASSAVADMSNPLTEANERKAGLDVKAEHVVMEDTKASTAMNCLISLLGFSYKERCM